MGAWGPNSFENDAAADWRDSHGVDLVSAALALDAVIDNDTDVLQADLGSVAVAAADIVADHAQDAALRSRAQMAIMAVAGPQSELAALWQEAGTRAHAEWVDALRGIQQRLSLDRKAQPPRSVTEVSPDMMLEAIESRLRGLEADMAMLRADVADGFRSLRITQEESLS